MPESCGIEQVITGSNPQREVGLLKEVGLWGTVYLEDSGASLSVAVAETSEGFIQRASLSHTLGERAMVLEQQAVTV